MISSEVQRTLVKSPPELWAEISDPESLARHLGEFGEVRITRVLPEQKVEWEAADTSGAVVIKPSGWGTKVKLTVSRELAGEVAVEEDEPAGAHEPEAAEAAEAIAVPAHDDLPEAPGRPADANTASETQSPIPAEGPSEASLAESLDREDDPEPPGTFAPAVQEPEPASRRGLLARLFGRRKARRARIVAPSSEPDPDAHSSEPEGVEPHDDPERDAGTDAPPALAAAPGPGSSEPEEQSSQRETTSPQEVQPEPADDVAAERLAAEDAAAEQIAVVLTGVLDRLGAAHHRPFSRA